MTGQVPGELPPPVPAHLRRGHLSDRMDRYRAFGFLIASCLVMAVIVILFLPTKRDLATWEVVGILAGAVLLAVALGCLVLMFSAATGWGIAHVITGSGNIAPASSFSLQESLVIRGRHDEAAAVYRDHLTRHPGDQEARLALADLLAGHLADPSGAEQLWLEVRNGLAGPSQERRATESLIAHYRRTGNTGREIAELARVADRFRGTVAGEAARRALATLKQAASEDQRQG